MMEIGTYVLVRTYSAGVHVGTLAARDGKEVTLNDARRIWSWKGANTLNEIALNGVGEGSRISEPVSAVLLTEAIEILSVAKSSQTKIETAGWAK
jgi:hypothetical protein